MPQIVGDISLFSYFQEAIKKKLEIQKQKQELLNKQIQEQKVMKTLELNLSLMLY